MLSVIRTGLIQSVLFLSCCALSAQQTLFTVDKDEILTDEFSYVYEKNNMNDKELYSQESLEEYLELYINFKLKVKAAEEAGLYEDPALRTELKKYRRQLAKSYLTDREVNDELVREAYERSKVERSVSHILLKYESNMTPADTMAMWDEMLLIKRRSPRVERHSLKRRMLIPMTEIQNRKIRWMVTSATSPHLTPSTHLSRLHFRRKSERLWDQ